MFTSLILIGVLVGVTHGSGLRRYDNCPAEQEILPCQCKNRGGSVLLSCQRSTLEELRIIFAILSQRVSLIEELMLEANDINELPPDAMGSLSVRRLFLWNNGIERIGGDSFRGLGNHLVELHIREPRLGQLASDALEKLRSLTDLVIEYTPLNELPNLRHCRALSSLHIDGSLVRSLNSRALHNLQLLKTVHITNSLVQQLGDGSLSHLHHLESVNLTGNRLTTFHAEWMADLPRLKVVDLRTNLLNDIDTVVNSLRGFRTLQEIHLDNNRFEHIGAVFVFPALVSLSVSNNRAGSVDASFERLPALRHLDLSFNAIRAWPPSLFASVPTLHDLNVAGNPIGSVMDIRRIISQLPQLRSVNLDNCGFHSIRQDSIGPHTTLEQLSLRNNSMRNMDAGSFHQLPSLIILNLSHNDLTHKLRNPRSGSNMPLGDLSGVFWNLPSLQSLDLSDNQIDTIDSGFFKALTSLRFLNLSRNGINDMDYGNLVQISSVDVLDLSHNMLTTISDQICQYLPNLEKIDVSFNDIIRVDGSVLSCRKLRSLDLSHNQINRLVENVFGGSIQSIDLSHNQLLSIPRVERLSRLKWLSLAANQISQLSSEDLQQNSRLEVVDLSENSIEQLPRSFFSGNGRLREIDLSGNTIAALPAHVFRNLATLDKLDLSFNRLSELMAEVFDPSTSLRYLNLSNNDITHLSTDGISLDGVQILDLKHNRIDDLSRFSVRNLPSLSELDLSHNTITSVQARSFESSKALLKLDLSDNLIEAVPSNSFGALPNLQVLKLARNRIERVEEKAFFDLISLEDLSLEENAIERIDSDAFHGPIFLRTLNLSTNALGHIEDAGIRNLLSLEVLDLSFNRISEIDSRSLRRLSGLLKLRMDNNSVCHLPEGFLNNQRRLQSLSLRNNRLYALKETSVQRKELVHLDIGGNPLQCDCQLSWLLELLQSNGTGSLFLPTDVVCRFSSEEEPVALQSVRPSRLLCQSRSESETEVNYCSRESEEVEMTTTSEAAVDIFNPPAIDWLAAPLGDQISDSAEPDDMDTPTIYAEIRNPESEDQNSPEQEEKTSPVTKESLISMVLPSLKMGLNFLPAIISVGSLMSELLKKQQQQKEDNRKNQKPTTALHLLNPPQEKPNRGPDYHHIPWLIPFTEPPPPVILSVTPSIVPLVPSVTSQVVPSVVPFVKSSVATSVMSPVTPSIVPAIKSSVAPPVVSPVAPSVVPFIRSSMVPSIMSPLAPSVFIRPSPVPSTVPPASFSAVPFVKPSVPPADPFVTIMSNSKLKHNVVTEGNQYVPVNRYPTVGDAPNPMVDLPVALDTSKWSPAFAVPSVHPVIHPLLANKERYQEQSNTSRSGKPIVVTTGTPITTTPPPLLMTKASVPLDYEIDYDEYYANVSTEQLLTLLRGQRANLEQNLSAPNKFSDDLLTAGSSHLINRKPIPSTQSPVSMNIAEISPNPTTTSDPIEDGSTESPMRILWYEHPPGTHDAPSISSDETRLETIEADDALSTAMAPDSNRNILSYFCLWLLLNYLQRDLI